MEDAGPPGSHRWLISACVALVVLPLVAALIGQLAIGADYNAAGDLADIELHTRDIGSHNVELGQYSREDWSHPGPAQFYAMVLPYRLTGSSSASANVAALVINGASVVGILLLARRRGGMPLFLTAAVGLAVLLRALGPQFLVEPWNPSLPVLPFGCFLFLIWEVACGGTWALPLAALVGTFCVQTHVAYAPLVIPLGILTVLLWRWRPHAGATEPRPRGRPRALLLTGAVLFVMWLPPVAQELRADDGNLARIAHYFAKGEGEPHTTAEGYEVVARQFAARPEWITGALDLTPFTGEPDLHRSAPLPLLLVPFAVGAFLWWRRHAWDALRLVLLTGAATVLSVVAISRTLGPIYHYRLGWTRVLAMVAMVTAGWSLWTALAARWPRVESRLLVPLSVLALLVLGVAGVPRFASADPPMAAFSEDIDQLTPDLVERLPATGGPLILRCDGDTSCIYLAGLVLWFERRGIDAEVDNDNGVIASGAPHRVHRHGPVRAVLHVARDARFYVLAAQPGREVLSYVGDAPSTARASLARKILALDDQHAAGGLDDEEYFFARLTISEQMGAGVGVVLEPFDDRDGLSSQ